MIANDIKYLNNAANACLEAQKAIESTSERDEAQMQALRHLEEAEGILRDEIEELENTQEEVE